MIVARPALPVGVAEVEIGVERFIGPGQESRIEAEINLESRPIRDARLLMSSSTWQATLTLWQQNVCVHQQH
jgi:hypothetical protein